MSTTVTRDERLRAVSPWRKLLSRPELGAVAGAVLVFIFFAVVAGDHHGHFIAGYAACRLAR